MNILRRVESGFRAARRAVASPTQRAEMFREEGVGIGPRTMVYAGVSFGSEPYLVTIGADCGITKDCLFLTHGGMRVLRHEPEFSDADLFGPISVGDNVYIGSRSIVLPGVTIGDNVLIGAGSVVTRDIPSNVVAAGVPCKPIKTLDEYRDSVRDKILHTKGMASAEKEAAIKNHFGIAR